MGLNRQNTEYLIQILLLIGIGIFSVFIQVFNGEIMNHELNIIKSENKVLFTQNFYLHSSEPEHSLASLINEVENRDNLKQNPPHCIRLECGNTVSILYFSTTLFIVLSLLIYVDLITQPGTNEK